MLIGIGGIWPEGLDAALIQSWIDGSVREARRDWLFKVVQAWEAAPDREQKLAIPHKRKPMTARKDRPRLPLTGEMWRTLLAEIARTDASYAMILANAPACLNERLIRSWEAGQRASVDAELWEFAMSRLASIEPGR